MQTIKTTLVWLFTILLSLGIGYSGVAKILDMEAWGRRFDQFGVNPELLLVVASFEIIAALLLLIPLTASYGGFIILVIMSVAVWSHINSGVGDPSTAAVYAAVALILSIVRFGSAWRPAAHKQ